MNTGRNYQTVLILILVSICSECFSQIPTKTENLTYIEVEKGKSAVYATMVSAIKKHNFTIYYKKNKEFLQANKDEFQVVELRPIYGGYDESGWKNDYRLTIWIEEVTKTKCNVYIDALCNVSRVDFDKDPEFIETKDEKMIEKRIADSLIESIDK